MDLKIALELIFFVGLILISILFYNGLGAYRKKSKEYWFIDLFSLFIQGTIVPIAQSYFILLYFLRDYAGTLEILNISAFLINFVLIDYIYYLIHKNFHKKGWWGFHLLHHSSPQMDVLVTSRNTFWTTFLMPYIWINGLFLVLLSDKTGFLVGISITAILDLWRHSPIHPSPESKLHKILSLIFITPFEHAWHHSTEKNNINYGANLNIWDKIHGTYYSPAKYPKSLGFNVKGSIFAKLFLPTKLERENQ